MWKGRYAAHAADRRGLGVSETDHTERPPWSSVSGLSEGLHGAAGGNHETLSSFPSSTKAGNQAPTQAIALKVPRPYAETALISTEWKKVRSDPGDLIDIRCFRSLEESIKDERG